MPPGLDKAQQTAVFACKIHHGRNTADKLTYRRGDRRADNTPLEYCNKQRVQHHVGNAACNGKRKAELGLFRRDTETLKQILQHKKRQRRKQNACVHHSLIVNFALAAKKRGNRLYKHQSQRGKHNAHCSRKNDDKSKVTLCGRFVTFAQSFADDSRAECAQHHDKRVNKVYRLERNVTRNDGNKNAVYDRVDGCENHHKYRRQRKAQQPFVCEVI